MIILLISMLTMSSQKSKENSVKILLINFNYIKSLNYTKMQKKLIDTHSKENDNENINHMKKKISSKVKIHHFSQLQSYRIITKPMILDEKQKDLSNKIQIQKNSLIRAKSRIQTKKGFIAYNKNRFSIKNTQIEGVKNKQIQNIMIDKQGQLDQQAEDEFDQELIEDMKIKKKFKVANQAKNKLKKITNNAEQVFLNIKVANIHTKKTCNTGKNGNEKIVDEMAQGIDQQKIFSQCLGFDQITQIRQQSVFTVANQKQQCNIFRQIFNLESGFSSNQDLKDNNFCFVSQIEKLTKVKINFQNNLSNLARKNALKTNNTKKLDFQMMNTDIGFNELINVASGFYTTQFVFFQLNHFRIRGDNQTNNSQVIQGNQIIYKDGCINQLVNIHHPNQQNYQISEHLNRQYTQQELQKISQFQTRKQQITNNFQKEANLLYKTINDKKLHTDLTQQIKDKIKSFLEMNRKPYSIDPLQRDKLLRINKASKTTFQNLKLKTINEVIHQHQKHSKIVNYLKHKMI